MASDINLSPLSVRSGSILSTVSQYGPIIRDIPPVSMTFPFLQYLFFNLRTIPSHRLLKPYTAPLSILSFVFFPRIVFGLFIATSGKQTVFKNCTAIGGTYGWIDTTPSDVGHMPLYIDCYGFGTNNTTINQTGFVLSNNYLKRAFRCIDNANGTSRNYPTTAD